MSRIQVLLTILISVLLVAIFWFLIHTPQRDEIARIEADIEAQETQQVTIRNRISLLEAVRAEAPELESTLAAATAVIPRDPALPAAIRQFQSAADESGLTLRAISASRPAVLDGDLGLSSIQVSIQLEGGYFQTVDFLRRVEDPSITPRAVLWSDANVTRPEAAELDVTLNGHLFTLAPPEPEVDEEDPEELLDEDGEPIEPDEDALDLEEDQ